MSADILRILVVLLGLIVVAVILFQQPKEGGMSAFTGGSGASGTVFGAKGSGSFLFKLTAGATLLFVVLVIALVRVTNVDSGTEIIKGATNEVPAAISTENTIPGEVPQAGAVGSSVPGQVKPVTETAPKE